ncbi:FAD-dependent thymidylate synthase [Spongiactinospora sp. TRM90649]|uniref:FAD-dependent thymidylate synthase n=1 Tax=Spongiactinospora sp. TRM90649 TaxID=3031114 RepID=UPI003211C7DF
MGLVDAVGSDAGVCRAARVSTRGTEAVDSAADAGLIRYLMRNRHGSPFEHNSLTFHIEAPIFVTRQLLKHRIGVSINEESGRYREFRPIFYSPLDENRPLTQTGKASEYRYAPGSPAQRALVGAELTAVFEAAWKAYREIIAAGVSREVARMCLPLATFSSLFLTLNARSLMHLLSLRTLADGARYPSSPQWETHRVAVLMEEFFAERFPLTHAAFDEYGRVSP